jgi:hypothetical protein
VNRLLACPFCRELFDAREAELCPACELPLAPLEQLPPSHEVLDEEAAIWERDPPEDRPRPWFDFGAGRGLLIGIALCGLCCFWLAPWVDISSPTTEVRSGYSLARGPAGWLWGGAIAWAVSIALAASRRSLRQMRGVRAILVVFAAMTGTEIVMLLSLSPRGSRHVYYAYDWSWGLYASLALSLLGMAAALRFGGLPRASKPALGLARNRAERASTLH